MFDIYSDVLLFLYFKDKEFNDMYNQEFTIEFLKVLTSTVITDDQKNQIYELCIRYNIEYSGSEFISTYEYLVKNNYIKGTIGSGFSFPFAITQEGLNYLESQNQR